MQPGHRASVEQACESRREGTRPMRLAALALLLAVATPAFARPAQHRSDRTNAPVIVHPPRVVTGRPVQVRWRHVEVRRPERRYFPQRARFEAMDPYRFQRLLQAVEAQPFGDGRILVLQTAVGENLFSVDQVIAVLDRMTFGSEKIE